MNSLNYRFDSIRLNKYMSKTVYISYLRILLLLDYI